MAFSLRPFLVLGTEERVALFTLGLVLVEELVEAEEVLAGGAVHVVPPVADEVLLVEDGAVGAQESVEVAVGLAHVEHLRREEKTVQKEKISVELFLGETICAVFFLDKL